MCIRDSLFGGGSLKRPLAGENLEEHKAQRVQIALRRHFSARELFGRHVGGRAGPRVRASHVSGQSGEPEIRDAHTAAPIQHCLLYTSSKLCKMKNTSQPVNNAA